MAEPANSGGTDDAPVEEALDHRSIAASLAQQAPFVLIDRVTALRPGQRIIGIKNVSLTDPYFRGHFPGNPILPGVLICEALAQAAILLVHRSCGTAPGRVLALTGLDGVRFRRPVVPGEQLVLEVALVDSGNVRWRLHGVGRVGDQVAAEADIVLSAVVEDSLR